MTEAQEALNQSLTFKPLRHERFDDVGYYVDYVRQLLEEKYGRDPLYTAGFRVYTAADIELHQIAKQAIQYGIKELYSRHGFRGPLKELTAKEIEPFCQQQVTYQQKHPPMKGHLQTAVVVQSEKGQQPLVVRFANEYGLLAKNVVPVNKEAAAGMKNIMSRLRLGDVVQVRLLDNISGRYQWQVSIDPIPWPKAPWFTWKIAPAKSGSSWGVRITGTASLIEQLRPKGSRVQPSSPSSTPPQLKKATGLIPPSRMSPYPCPGGRAGEPWTPSNYDHSFYGTLDLATALALSRNLPAVRLMISVGVPAVVKMAKAVGLSTEIYPNYSSALGSSEVTLFELTRAFSTFPNGGQLANPVVIERLEDRDGRILEEAQPNLRQVMKPRTGKIMTELLLGVVQRGTATKVQVLKRPIGGKTGTTNSMRDAWFIGFTPSVTAGVWIGMDDEQSLGSKETGGQAAAPIFIKFMQEASKKPTRREIFRCAGHGICLIPKT